VRRRLMIVVLSGILGALVPATPGWATSQWAKKMPSHVCGTTAALWQDSPSPDIYDAATVVHCPSPTTTTVEISIYDSQGVLVDFCFDSTSTRLIVSCRLVGNKPQGGYVDHFHYYAPNSTSSSSWSSSD